MVNGGPEVGSYLTTHHDIAKVSFTEQLGMGQRVASNAAGKDEIHHQGAWRVEPAYRTPKC